MTCLPASPVRPTADIAASRPAAFAGDLKAFAQHLGRHMLGLVTVSLLALAILAFAPVGNDPSVPGPAFRPALAVMAPAEAPLMHRLDRDITVIAAADIELPADPALPGRLAEAAPVPCAIAVPFSRTSATVPAPAPLASPLRPPRAA